MAVRQISRIEHRRGTSAELPTALAPGEIGMTTDTGEMFFGASDHPRVQGRKSYPYQNIKVLTELDVQRGIRGDVYYHGPLMALRVPNVASGVFVSAIPLWKHGAREFANFDYSLVGNNGQARACGTMAIVVHPTNPSASTVNVTQTADLGWTGGSPQGKMRLSSLDNQNQDSGITWLAFNNTYGYDLVLSVSGREWTTPTVS